MNQKTKNKSKKFFLKRHFKVLAFLVVAGFLLSANCHFFSIFTVAQDRLEIEKGNTNNIIFTHAEAQDDETDKGNDNQNLLDKISGLVGDTIAESMSGLLKGIVDGVLWVLNVLLNAVFTLFGIILIAAGILFDWAVNPSNFKTVLDMKSVKEGWTIVRDFFNLFFILVLLYSAFCTIFQVEKYHLKKILLMLVLMALLVNFSFPIARFIIDLSNVTMYFIINQAFPDVSDSSGISSEFVRYSSILKSIVPNEAPTTSAAMTVQLCGAIVFMFLLAITILAIAVLLIIRIVVLAILVIFSPVGFVAAILPSTKHLADSWWSQLFKQSFFGPVMLFMVWLSINIMQNVQMNVTSEGSKFNELIKNNTPSGSPIEPLIATGAKMAIPITILWVGLIVAQKLGAYGASAVVGRASQFAKAAPGWGAKYGWRGAAYGVRKAVSTKDTEGNVVRRGWSQRLFGEGKAGETVDKLMRRSTARADMRKADTKRYKNYQAMLNNLSTTDRIKEFESTFKGVDGYKKFIAAQSVMKAGGHKSKDMSRGTLNQLHKYLSDKGDVENAKKITEDRYDADIDMARVKSDPKYKAEVQGKLKDRIKRQMASGDHKKNTSVGMLDDEFTQLMIDSSDVDTVSKMISEMPNVMQDRAREITEDSLRSMSLAARNDASNTATVNWRKVGASASKDAHKYFAQMNATGVLNNRIDPAFATEAQKFFDRKTGKALADYSEEALEEIGEVVSSSTSFENAAKNLSNIQAQKFKAGGTRNSINSVKTFVATDRYWSTV